VHLKRGLRFDKQLLGGQFFGVIMVKGAAARDAVFERGEFAAVKSVNQRQLDKV